MKKNIKALNKNENLLILLLLIWIAFSVIISVYSLKQVEIDEDNKIEMKAQNEELRSENKRLVDKYNELAKDYEKVNETLKEKHYQDSYLKALVSATHKYETGHGTSDLWVYNNNAGGIKGYYSGEYLVYESKAHGLSHLESLLEESYINVYGYDIIAIRKAYDPAYTDQQLEEFVSIFKIEFENIMNGVE